MKVGELGKKKSADGQEECLSFHSECRGELVFFSMWGSCGKITQKTAEMDRPQVSLDRDWAFCVE